MAFHDCDVEEADILEVQSVSDMFSAFKTPAADAVKLIGGDDIAVFSPQLGLMVVTSQYDLEEPATTSQTVILSLVDACVQNILDIRERTEAERGAQLVFVDSSTPASGRWNIQDDVRRRLIEAGVPESEIACVTDAKGKSKQKEALYEKVRDGDIRILLGSTTTLGTGTNVQTRLAAIHDLDCPWRPSDLEQRLGRIVRQGNGFDRASTTSATSRPARSTATSTPSSSASSASSARSSRTSRPCAPWTTWTRPCCRSRR